MEKAKDAVPERRKENVSEGESYLPSLGEKLVNDHLDDEILTQNSPSFLSFSQESHHTYKRRQDWTEDGQKTSRTSEGTYRVGSVKAALPYPDPSFLPFSSYFGTGHLRGLDTVS